MEPGESRSKYQLDTGTSFDLLVSKESIVYQQAYD